MTKTDEWFCGDFKDWLDLQLYRAYLDARKHKRKTADEHVFEVNISENLRLLAADILNHEYKPSRGIAFITFKPVIREIFAAPFRDRIVHHLLYNISADWWDRRMIHDSYSCRVGKGTLFGAKRLQRAIHKVEQGGKVNAYVIKLDIQGYFMSLDRAKLFERVCWGLNQQFPNGGQIYRLCKYLWHEVIFDDPVKGAKRRGRLSDWRYLPLTKSLFCQPLGKGIVIGNLSSQLLSNIYLDQLDRFIQYTLGYKYYGRYVDDFYIVVPEPQLKAAVSDIALIEEFLAGLELKLHPKKRHIQPVKHGVEFLGFVVYPHRILPGKRLKKNFRAAARAYSMGLKDNESIISYLGHLKHIDGDGFAKRLFDEMGWDYRI